MQLSKPMLAAIEMAETSSSQALFRWPGGFWTGDPWPGKEGPSIPFESVGFSTVEALIERGKFEVVERMKRGDPSRVNLI